MLIDMCYYGNNSNPHITDNDIENIVCFYELLVDDEEYMTTPSVGAVLSAVWDVHHALWK